MGNSDHPLHRQDAQQRSAEQADVPEPSLNRRIAEALGWRLEKRTTTADDGLPFEFTVLVDPQGGVPALGDPDDPLYGLAGHTEKLWDYFPHNYEHSLDAVIAELPVEWYDISITILLTYEYHATILLDDPPMGYKHKWEGRGSTRQAAAAYALEQWALWKAKQP